MGGFQALAVTTAAALVLMAALCEGGAVRPLRTALACRTDAQCQKACADTKGCYTMGRFDEELDAESRAALLKSQYVHLYYVQCPHTNGLIGKVEGGVLKVKPADREDLSIHHRAKYCLQLDLNSGSILDIQGHDSCPQCGARGRAGFAIDIARSFAVKMGLGQLTADDYAEPRCASSARTRLAQGGELRSPGGWSLLSVLTKGETFLERQGFRYQGSKPEEFNRAKLRLAQLKVGEVVAYMSRASGYKRALDALRERAGEGPTRSIDSLKSSQVPLGEAVSKLLREDCGKYDEFMSAFGNERKEGAPWYGALISFLYHLHEAAWVMPVGHGDSSSSDDSDSVASGSLASAW